MRNPRTPKGCQPCLDPAVCLQSADRFELLRRWCANKLVDFEAITKNYSFKSGKLLFFNFFLG